MRTLSFAFSSVFPGLGSLDLASSFMQHCRLRTSWKTQRTRRGPRLHFASDGWDPVLRICDAESAHATLSCSFVIPLPLSDHPPKARTRTALQVSDGHHSPTLQVESAGSISVLQPFHSDSFPGHSSDTSVATEKSWRQKMFRMVMPTHMEHFT